MNDYPERIQSVLAALDIPADLIEARSLVPCPEAQELVVAARDDDGREYRLAPAAASAWERMNAAALSDGVVLKIASAFRSIDRQVEILREKLAQGVSLEAILAVSAPPGFSEHHTGCAIDLTTDGVPALEVEFENTAAFRWLTENAARFGFVLSFPQGNPYGYEYEPWHWCFKAPSA